MPQACNVTMSYQVIHEKVPDRDYNFYGGPAGGLAEGFKSQRTIKYDDNDVGKDPAYDFDTGDRFIPRHHLWDEFSTDNIGEKNYLDRVDIQNEAPFSNAQSEQYRVRPHHANEE